MRFGGSVNAKTVENKLQTLRLWVERQGIAFGQEVYVARFNPPFMPPIFRHNEIMIALL
ncbi:MAG: heme-binding protein [Erysipelotrichaceae bacterium]